MVAKKINEGEIVIEYGSGQKIRFSRAGEIAAETEDSIDYVDPETGDDITLPGKETWADIELERPLDDAGELFFEWMINTDPSQRTVSAAISRSGGRLTVLSKARVSAPRQSGIDLDGSELAMVFCNLQYSRPTRA